MTVGERIKDIEKRSGLSEKVIRAVLEAETQSVMDSLEKGEKAQLIGRCTFTPAVTTRLGADGNETYHLRASAKISSRISNYLFSRDRFLENDTESIEKEIIKLDGDVRLFQIDELA